MNKEEKDSKSGHPSMDSRALPGTLAEGRLKSEALCKRSFISHEGPAHYKVSLVFQ